MNKLKRFLSAFILTNLLLLGTARPALAMNFWDYMRDIYSPAVYDDPNINLQKHVKETLAIIPWAMVDLILNSLPLPGAAQGTNILAKCLSANFQPVDCGISFLEGLTGYTPTKTPPVANIEKPKVKSQFISNLRESLQFVPKAQAQGYGYIAFWGQANVVGQLWRATRNIAYLLSAFLLIISGIMIMFRVKINPQAVITIEQALPKFAITLLLITFSFAIAGFVIDLTYVGEYLLAQVIGNAGIPVSGWVPDILSALAQITGHPALSCCNASTIFSLYTDMIIGNIFFLTVLVFLALFGNLLNILAAFASLLGPFGGFIGFCILILFALALLFNILKLYFALAKAYAMMIITIIIGPLQILFGILPTSGGFGSWLNNYLKNLLVFPLVSTCYIVGILLIFSVKITCFLGQATASAASCNGYSPTLIGGSADFAILLAGLGIILAAPGIPKALEAFFAKKPFDVGTAIGESLGTPAGMGAEFARMRSQRNPPGTWGNASWSAVEQILRQLAGGGGGRTGCLPPNTPIKTSTGNLPIISLKVGMLVWSLNDHGQKILVPIAKVSFRKVPRSHKIQHLTLSDGRQLWSSSTHPLSNNLTVCSLRPGDRYDGTTVVTNTKTSYGLDKTYDLLPDSPTGCYFANNVTLKSTLFFQPGTSKLILVKNHLKNLINYRQA
jgi:hypothetical protein